MAAYQQRVAWRGESRRQATRNGAARRHQACDGVKSRINGVKAAAKIMAAAYAGVSAAKNNETSVMAAI
jgi:hypothetical protein